MILTTHVGSLVRPPDLVALLKAKEAGERAGESAFLACLRNAVAQVVRLPRTMS